MYKALVIFDKILYNNSIMKDEYNDIYKTNAKITLVFDVDGHLLDTESDQYLYYRNALLELFEDKPEVKKKIEEKLPYGEKGRLWYIRHLMGKTKDHLQILSEEFAPITPQEFEKIDGKVFDDIFANTSPDIVFPYIEELLAIIQKDKDCKIYFVSGSTEKGIYFELSNSDLIHYVPRPFKKHIYTREKYRKSKQEVIKHIIRENKFDKRFVIVSGDSVGDMEATKDIDGVKVFAIGNLGMLGYSSDEEVKKLRIQELKNAGADKIVHNSLELKEVILEKIKENKKIIFEENKNRVFLSQLMSMLTNSRYR